MLRLGRPLTGLKHLMAVSYIVLGVALTPMCAAQDQSCSGKQYRVVRVDNQSKRLFVVTLPSAISSARKATRVLFKLQSFVGKCHGSWENVWSVSFFSNPEYAGYKDEPGIQPYVNSGEWQAGYVGEYENEKHTLILNPLLPEKVKKLRLSLTP
jgi:hypothetical protein